ncbi:MAG: hypothetical protein IH965_11985 [Gemmatimonadetes bacterium]|nr:hypothetical protein [Gemmatimonadota bacterium]
MSPEQSEGAPDLDGRSDTYSLACMLYEMFSGEPPYRGPTAQAIIAKRMASSVPLLRAVRDAVPTTIDAALTKACPMRRRWRRRRNPNDRLR